MFIKYVVMWFIVVNLLPDNAKLIEPIKPEGVKAIQSIDLDKDGEEEIVASYKIIDEASKLYVITIKKIEGKWNIVQNLKYEGDRLEEIIFTDTDGDGVVEVQIDKLEYAGYKKQVLECGLNAA